MVKSYPGQRWPDHRTASNKKKHPQNVQTGDAAWKRSLNADIKDENAASKHYKRKADQAKDEENKATYESMSFDEARHEENLKKMKADKQ